MVDRLKANCGGDPRLIVDDDPSLTGGWLTSSMRQHDGVGRRPTYDRHANPDNRGPNL